MSHWGLLWWTVAMPVLLAGLAAASFASADVGSWSILFRCLCCTPFVVFVAVSILSERHSVRVRTAGVLGGMRGTRDRSATLVGGGWSCLLTRSVPGSRLYTDSLKGVRREGGVEWWGAGMTIEEVRRALRRRGLAFTGHPSIATATLGGWIASASHGSGGTLWKKSTGRVRVYDRDGGDVRELPDKALFGPLANDVARYILLEVQVLPVPNVECTRVAFDLLTETDARRYMTAPSYVRVLFVTPREATCFLWVPPASARVEEECRVVRAWWMPPWLWSVLPSRGLPHLARSRWTKRMRLDEAHLFGPTPPMIGTWVMALVYVNFELFVKASLTPPQLFQASQRLQRCLRCGERVEIRGGSGKWTFFDVALIRPDENAIRAVLDAISTVVGGAATVTLHRGKAQVPLSPPFHPLGHAEQTRTMMTARGPA